MPTIKLYANLRKVAGTKELSITRASAGAVVFELVNQYPALATHLLENGKIRPHIIITINGHPIDDINAPVMERDVVSIFPPMAGG